MASARLAGAFHGGARNTMIGSGEMDDGIATDVLTFSL
jgi:hypothetical protein